MPSALAREESESIQNLLQQTMGASESAAIATTLTWERHESQIAYMSTFIHSAIESQINEYRKQSFAKFGLDIAVWPAVDAKRTTMYMRHFGKVTIGYNRYVFGPRHNEEPSKTMPVRMFQGTVQVYFCSSWQPISAYLDEVGTHRTWEETPQAELDRQYHWWRTNGKSFNIRRLPGELRNAIFDCVFPSEAQPFPNSRCRRRGRMVPTFQHSPMALMRTTRQMRREASERFYQGTTFLIEHGYLLFRTLNNRIRQDRLRHIRLDLSHSGYLNLFHFQYDEETTKPYVKHQLRELSNLTSLEIYINAPSRIAEKTWLEGACQKTAVDMIVDAAWPSIRCLPVTFTGYIKDSQKRDIEAGVKVERYLYNFFKTCSLAGGYCGSLRAYDAFVSRMMAEEQGGVRLDGKAWDDDGEEEVQWKDMSAVDLQAALWCSCKTRCTLEGWDPED